MLKKILIGIGAAIALLVVVIALQPSKFHYERSATIGAPPETVFANISDLHAWRAWSPWEKLDPNMKRIYGGATSGVGAKYAWVGNDDVGEGRMTIEIADKPSDVAIKLEFLKPFEATNTSTFKLSPEGAGTKVTWSMDGENNFVSKAACLFMDMDAMIGKDFEKGLAQLKSVAESAPKGDVQAAVK